MVKLHYNGNMIVLMRECKKWGQYQALQGQASLQLTADQRYLYQTAAQDPEGMADLFSPPK